MSDAGRSPPRYRALFLGATGPAPAHVAQAWLAAGHEILELWTSSRIRPRDWRRDRRLGLLAPQWSLSAAIRRGRLAHRTIPDAVDWPDAAARVEALRPDLVLSVYFPRLLPRRFLERLAVPALNLHPALLPRYRGPYPLMAMLLDEAADQFGGVTLHEITAAMDAGPIVAAAPVALPADRNVRQWEFALAEAAAGLAIDAIPRYLRGEVVAQPQDETAATLARPTTAALSLRSTATADRVEWLCATVGRLQPITIRIDGDDLRITDLKRRLGPATGAAPRVGWRHIEVDLLDGRVLLRRRQPGDGKRLRLARLYCRIATRPPLPGQGR